MGPTPLSLLTRVHPLFSFRPDRSPSKVGLWTPAVISHLRRIGVRGCVARGIRLIFNGLKDWACRTYCSHSALRRFLCLWAQAAGASRHEVFDVTGRRKALARGDLVVEEQSCEQAVGEDQLARALSLLARWALRRGQKWGNGEGGGLDDLVSSVLSNGYSLDGTTKQLATPANRGSMWKGWVKAYENAS